MRQPRHAWPRGFSGFTLIETIMVLVLLAIAAVGISSVQGNIFARQSSVKDLQVRTRLLMECAEQILAVRRHMEDGYEQVATTSFGTNLCGGVPVLAGYSIPSVTITDPYSGAACPTGSSCKLVSITQAGMTPVTVMVADY